MTSPHLIFVSSYYQVSISSPVWEKVSFLDVTSGGQVTHFGVFGYTGSKAAIGYTFAPDRLKFDDTKLNTGVIHSLTFVLILYPIGECERNANSLYLTDIIKFAAAGLAGISVFFGLCGACYHRAGTVFMSLFAAIATVCTLVAWAISMALFGIARNHVRDHGGQAQYGNANWIALGGLVALLVGFCTAACGVCGHYRRHRSYY
jgi:hypothetical protein